MRLFINLLLIICTTSCVHVYYAPSTPNAPLFSGKQQTNISAAYSSGGNLSSYQAFELQLAHSVSDHVGITMDGLTGGRTQNVIDFNSSGGSHKESGNGSYIEFGAGYFGKLDKQHTWVGEIYAGTGFGTINNDYGSGDNSKVNHSKLFIQPGIGYKIPNFEVLMVPRISFVHWAVKDMHITSSSLVNEHMNYISSNPDFVAFEPAVLIRGGGETVKAQMGLSFSSSRKREFSDQTGIVETFNFSFGILLNLKPAKKPAVSSTNQ